MFADYLLKRLEMDQRRMKSISISFDTDTKQDIEEFNQDIERLKALIREARAIITTAKPDYVYQENCNIWRSEQQKFLEKTEGM
jgi:hypothetical protein